MFKYKCLNLYVFNAMVEGEIYELRHRERTSIGLCCCMISLWMWYSPYVLTFLLSVDVTRHCWYYAGQKTPQLYGCLALSWNKLFIAWQKLIWDWGSAGPDWCVFSSRYMSCQAIKLNIYKVPDLFGAEISWWQYLLCERQESEQAVFPMELRGFVGTALCWYCCTVCHNPTNIW